MDYSITNEYYNDAKEGIKIIREIKNKISRLHGYKGYYSKLICNKLKKAMIFVRRNAITLSNEFYL
ncbi:hypothetical protein SE19_05825 [Acidiplasma aeolicum]|uniref:Transposase n=1 Tax=Acidiplasma aeolicum TaxID=507754 RepID=A0A0P9F413_9ARCH|nr:hypothetical protein [Acidiplasma aeolicum]KPV46371.1 hypothetical protein SE19_05825 [Acidiplasma aeolicum]KQB36199.1 hypothetical protein AOG54_07850 [Acidiplasma aeolicum]